MATLKEIKQAEAAAEADKKTAENAESKEVKADSGKMKFRVLRGAHREEGVTTRAGGIVESTVDLVAKHGKDKYAKAE